MLIRGVVVDAGVDERAVIAVLMDEGRYMRDGARSCWTFVAKGVLGIEQMMATAAPICERVSASLSPGVTLYSV